MKHDYLWDKTGEPDATIERLETVLRSLRYQPLPPNIKRPGLQQNAWRRRFPILIAATISFIAVMLGIWFVGQVNQPQIMTSASRNIVLRNVQTSDEATSDADSSHTTSVRKASGVSPEPKRGADNAAPAVFKSRATRERITPRLTIAAASLNNKIEEQRAVAQLIKALQITNAKLAFVRRKAQDNAAQFPAFYGPLLINFRKEAL